MRKIISARAGCLTTFLLGTTAFPAAAAVIDYPPDSTRAVPIVLIDNTTQLQVNSGSATQSGAISQAGGSFRLEKIGDGTLILTGENTYTATTTITAGTLQIGNGGATGSLLSVPNNINGTLIFNRTGTYQLGQFNGGTIGGTGNIQVTGGGTMVLVAYAYDVGMSIAAGNTVRIGDGNTDGFMSGIIVNNGALVADEGDDVTLPGIISGSGSLTKLGNNTLILTGVNSYTGATTISAGTLQIGGGSYDASGISLNPGTTLRVGGGAPLFGDLVDNGTLDMSGFGIFTYDGNVTGTGNIIVRRGRSNLGGVIAPAGGVDISSATVEITGRLATPVNVQYFSTLQIGNGGTTGSVTTDISNTGSVVFDRSDSMTYAGVISGTGRIYQNGSGTTILTGDNTSTGLIIINAGTLQIGDGGTKGSIANVTGISNAGTVIFNRSDTVRTTLGIGGGTAIQAGTGTLIFDGSAGDNTFNVNSGATLLVGSDVAHRTAYVNAVNVSAGAVFGGHGTATGAVTNAGTVAPGASIGTLTVNSYTQAAGGLLDIDVAPTVTDRLHANGPVGLDGTVKFDFASGAYLPGTYTILDSTGTISGRFASITTTGLPSNVLYDLQYTGATVNLVLTTVSDPGAQLYGDFNRQSYNTAIAFNDMIFDHASARPCAVLGQTKAGKTGCPEVAFWYQGFGNVSSFDATGSYGAFTGRNAGAMAGVDYNSGTGYWIGVASAFAIGTMKTSDGNGRVNTSSFAIALTGGLPMLTGTLDGDILYVANNGTARRVLTPSSGPLINATSSPKADLYDFAAQYSQPLIDSLSAQARFDYTDFSNDAFVENGATARNLSLAGRNSSAFFGNFGLRWSPSYTLKSGTLLMPEATAGVRTLLSAPDDGVTSSMASNTTTVLEGRPMDNADFVGGIGITAKKRGSSYFLRLGGRSGAHEREGSVTLGAQIRL